MQTVRAHPQQLRSTPASAAGSIEGACHCCDQLSLRAMYEKCTIPDSHGQRVGKTARFTRWQASVCGGFQATHTAHLSKTNAQNQKQMGAAAYRGMASKTEGCALLHESDAATHNTQHTHQQPLGEQPQSTLHAWQKEWVGDMQTHAGASKLHVPASVVDDATQKPCVETLVHICCCFRQSGSSQYSSTIASQQQHHSSRSSSPWP